MAVGENVDTILRKHGYDPGAAARLDPFDMDGFFAEEFHKLNSGEMDSRDAHRRIGKVGSHMGHMVVRHNLVDLNDPDQSHAALRDATLVLGSALVNGHKPSGRGGIMHGLGDLSRTFIKLGTATRGVPMGTFYSYTDMNADSETGRQRRFTDLKGEAVFIDALKGSSLALGAALLELCTTNPNDPDQTLAALTLARDGFTAELDGMVAVAKNRELRQLFSSRIQPFFSKAVIGARYYFAPGGSQLPSSALTCLIEAGAKVDGATDDAGRRARELHAGTYKYLPLIYREAIDKWESAHAGKSLVALLDEQRIPDDDPRRVILGEIRDKHTKFREVHRAGAGLSLGQRRPGAVGSGGGTLELLDELTRDAEARSGYRGRMRKNSRREDSDA